jgi:hypothetical protein
LRTSKRRSPNELRKKLSTPAPCAKGKQSFEVLQTQNPATLNALPSFARAIRILKARLLH